MAIIALDIGGTKIAGALFSNEGNLLEQQIVSVSDREGRQIGQLIIDQLTVLVDHADSLADPVDAVGTCVPGIFDPSSGTVWAPNLAGWESYPLLEEISSHFKHRDIPVRIDSDRSCYILGEVWKGNAQGCENAIFLAVGTGIGAGIMVNGEILRGISNCAGSVGWMALDRPHQTDYSKYGCLEYHASGEGIVRIARKYLSDDTGYRGGLREKGENKLTTKAIFKAYKNDSDKLAERVICEAIEFWGMGVANVISIFNPEKIILGGGVFKAAAPLVKKIRTEAERWAQPIGFGEVSIELSALGSEAGIYGAAYLALTAYKEKNEL